MFSNAGWITIKVGRIDFEQCFLDSVQSIKQVYIGFLKISLVKILYALNRRVKINLLQRRINITSRHSNWCHFSTLKLLNFASYRLYLSRSNSYLCSSTDLCRTKYLGPSQNTFERWNIFAFNAVIALNFMSLRHKSSYLMIFKNTSYESPIQNYFTSLFASLGLHLGAIHK